MTLSEIRRAIDALKRKFATELTIIKARRIAEAVANGWDPAEPPEPHDVIQRFVKAGCCLPPPSATSPATSTTPDARATSPNPATWSSICFPGLTAAGTANSSTGTFRLSPPVPRCCRFRPIIKRPRHQMYLACKTVRTKKCELSRMIWIAVVWTAQIRVILRSLLWTPSWRPEPPTPAQRVGGKRSAGSRGGSSRCSSWLTGMVRRDGRSAA